MKRDVVSGDHDPAWRGHLFRLEWLGAVADDGAPLTLCSVAQKEMSWQPLASGPASSGTPSWRKAFLLHQNSQIKLLVVVMGLSEVAVCELLLLSGIQCCGFPSACVKKNKTYINSKYAVEQGVILYQFSDRQWIISFVLQFSFIDINVFRRRRCLCVCQVHIPH